MGRAMSVEALLIHFPDGGTCDVNHSSRQRRKRLPKALGALLQTARQGNGLGNIVPRDVGRRGDSSRRRARCVHGSCWPYLCRVTTTTPSRLSSSRGSQLKRASTSSHATSINNSAMDELEANEDVYENGDHDGGEEREN